MVCIKGRKKVVKRLTRDCMPASERRATEGQRVRLVVCLPRRQSFLITYPRHLSFLVTYPRHLYFLVTYPRHRVVCLLVTYPRHRVRVSYSSPTLVTVFACLPRHPPSSPCLRYSLQLSLQKETSRRQKPPLQGYPICMDEIQSGRMRWGAGRDSKASTRTLQSGRKPPLECYPIWVDEIE